jgi:signal transduction histidine kinase
MAREVGRSQRAMRDLLANVSHDLRTPLTSIQGFSQAMVDGTLKHQADYEKAGRIINEEAGRMQHLVEDLLYLSRIESGQLELERRAVALAEIVVTCASRARRRGLPEGVSVETVVQATPIVSGDARRLEQVVENLLENALRYTPTGGSVTITLREERRKGIVSVHNTGSYIPEEDLPRLFERFYQANRSRSRTSHGSGLGLAIAHEIVEAHHGTLTARSDPEAGTTFEISLPLSDERAEQTRAYASPTDSEARLGAPV